MSESGWTNEELYQNLVGNIAYALEIIEEFREENFELGYLKCLDDHGLTDTRK